MKFGWLVGVLALAVMASPASAYMTWQCDDDNDGAVDMDPAFMVWTVKSETAEAGEYELKIPERVNWYPAHLDGVFTQAAGRTSKVLVGKEVTNGTTETWMGYKFNIYMDQSFTVPAVLAPENWHALTVTYFPSGTYVNSHGISAGSWSYKAVVEFYADSSDYCMAPNDTKDFGAKLSFGGPVDFEIEQFGIVPEPATLALVLLGGGLFFIRRR